MADELIYEVGITLASQTFIVLTSRMATELEITLNFCLDILVDYKTKSRLQCKTFLQFLVSYLFGIYFRLLEADVYNLTRIYFDTNTPHTKYV